MNRSAQSFISLSQLLIHVHGHALQPMLLAQSTNLTSISPSPGIWNQTAKPVPFPTHSSPTLGTKRNYHLPCTSENVVCKHKRVRTRHYSFWNSKKVIININSIFSIIFKVLMLLPFSVPVVSDVTFIIRERLFRSKGWPFWFMRICLYWWIIILIKDFFWCMRFIWRGFFGKTRFLDANLCYRYLLEAQFG